MAHVSAIDPAAASPQVAAIFAEIKSAFGMVPNLFKAYSHHPPLLEANWYKVKKVMMEGAISRKAKESIALLVSKANGCKYCVAAHRGALRSIGVSPEEIRTIEADLDQAGFERKERALIRLALHANRAANDPADEVFAELRTAGATDAEIVEALGVMEVFASFNRFLDILQVEVDF
jgi:uncharacterized peroxidase-related enzyme